MPTEEFYKHYRPTEFKDVIGQSSAVRILEDYIKAKRVPHALLFVGSSGCGKTTLARILRHKLGCGDHDYQEKNASETRGIDLIREMKGGASMAPISGRCRVWVIDEAGGLTGDAQRAFLKLLEDTPKRAYFILATTDPHKLLPTIRTRCTEVEILGLGGDDLWAVIDRVADAEKFKINEDVGDKIVELALGSARKALVLLDTISSTKDKDEQLELLVKAVGETDARGLSDALLPWGGKFDWNAAAKIIRDTKEDPEGLRRMILARAATILVGRITQAGKVVPPAKGAQAYHVQNLINEFEDNYFNTGRAGLARSAYAATHYDTE